MTETLDKALEVAAQPKDTKTVRDYIEGMKPELEKSLQSPAAAEILIRHYFSAIRFNDLLRQCTGESLVAALLLSAQVRLEPGPLGHVYLIPYKNTKQGTHEVVWVLGYTGIIELARRGGAVGLRSTIVWDVDEYVPPWEDERGVHFSLKPGDVEKRDERKGVLVSWKERDGARLVTSALDVPVSRIERAIKASKAAQAKSGPWVTDTDAMWRKTGVRAARPFLPLSPELALADASDGRLALGVDVDAQGAAQPVLEASE